MARRTCPPKHTKEYKRLEKVVGEKEAFRVYLSYGEDIPASFAHESLTDSDVTAMANYYSRQQSVEEEQHLLRRLPQVIDPTSDALIDRELGILNEAIIEKTSPKKPEDGYDSLEDKRITQEKIDLLKRGLNANVIQDDTIDGFAQVDPYEADEVPTIRVNFKNGGLQTDTIIHEFGHIFIDALGGMKDAMVQMGRKHLVGSDVEDEILSDSRYNTLDKDTIDKEIVARAIGREGQRIYSAKDGSLMERFMNWARLFFNRVRKTFGMDYNGAMYLAEQMLTNQINIDAAQSIGSRVIQRQAFPGTITAEQESSMSSVVLMSTNISQTTDGKFYTSKFLPGRKLQRTTNRMNSVYPQTAFPEERAKYFPHSRSWGNINDTIWGSVINGRSWEQVLEDVEETRRTNEGPIYAVSKEAMLTIYETANQFVKDQLAKNNIILAQQAIYSEGTMVGGTTDIVVIKPSGRIDIYDNKSSTNPTREDVNYGPENDWNYWDRGNIESYAQKHQKQLSAYQKMYEDLGIGVDNLYIVPTRWLEINEDNATVDKVDNEPIIRLSYSKEFANKIIDNKQKELLDKLVTDDSFFDTIEVMNKQIAERVEVVTAKYERDKNNQSWYTAMLALANELSTNNTLGNIEKFIQLGIENVSYVQRQLTALQRQGGFEQKDTILIYKAFANTWNLVEEMLPIIEQIELEFNPPYNKEFEEHLSEGTEPEEDMLEDFVDYKKAKFTVDYMRKAAEEMKKLQSLVDSVNNKYQSLALEKTARDMASVSKWGEVEFRNNKLKEYKKNTTRPKGQSIGAWEAAGKEWVNEQVAASRAQIATMNYNHFKELLQEAPHDIDSLSMWIVDPRNQNDGILQVAEKLLSKADFTANNRFIAETRKAEGIYQDFVQAVGSELKYEEMYKDMYEVVQDGDNERYFLVGKYNYEFIIEERKWRAKNRKTGYKPKFEEIKAFYAQLRAEHQSEKYKELMARDENDPVRKMYESLVDRFEEVDRMLPKTHSLSVWYSDGYNEETRTVERIPQYRLPSIRKSTTDRLINKGLGTNIRGALQDAFVKTSADTEFGEGAAENGTQFKVKESIKKILVTEQNREAKFVPIHYRNKIEQGQQSLDLMSISMIDYYQAAHHEEKSELVPTMEMLMDVLQKRKVVQTDSMGNTLINAVKAGLPFKLTNAEKASNAYRALQSMVDDRLYGIGTLDIGNIMGVNMTKVTERLMGWTGDTFLMLNHLAAGTGLLQGTVMNWMEAVAGTDISKMSLLKAEFMYLGATSPRTAAGIINDIGKRRPTGLVNLLIDRFNARSDFHGLHARYGSNRATNLSNLGTLHGLQNMQEHFVQSTLMMGILMDEVLMDDKGKPVLDEEGKKVSLFDAYEVTEDGFLNIKSKYAPYVNPELEFEVSARIREVAKQAHGNYDAQNKAMLQRYVIGKMVFMLRKWLVTGVQKRYRGIGSAVTKETPTLGTTEGKFFSESLARFEEGSYTTAIKFIRNLWKETKFIKLRATTGILEEMTAEERANLKRAVYEVSMIMLSLLASQTLAALAKDIDDEDDRKRVFYMATLTRRLYSELMFYVDISMQEPYRILKSPMATLSMLERVFKLLGQGKSDLWNLEFEEYKSGPRKGTLKIKKKLFDLFPIINQFDRDTEEIYKIITNA